ncbi:hypothetical protein ZHAS_00018961 [Anopheles sinensis]|uniref:Uncharacterized protein n=1 Tax=Anopheles sinensis TaxID=74873 RepID=A0A084WL30_ANOSI|nr:hypothetical protein ZHAS_00018961 [Anopheles sinensis]
MRTTGLRRPDTTVFFVYPPPTPTSRLRHQTKAEAVRSLSKRWGRNGGKHNQCTCIERGFVPAKQKVKGSQRFVRISR